MRNAAWRLVVAVALAGGAGQARAGAVANTPTAQYEAGMAEVTAGRWHMAISPFENALRLDPFKSDPTIHRRLVEAYVRMGRPGDAVRAADRGLGVHGGDPWLLEWKKEAFLRLRQPDQARSAGLEAERAQWKQAPAPGKTVLRLPVEGAWKVRAAAGDGMHFGLSGRFALDFAAVDDKGNELNPRALDPRQNASWFAWDRPVAAPADGTVVAVENAMSDNSLVGATNDRSPLGNFIVVKHATGELTLLAHLRKGSILVRAGESVVAGHEIARAGNSGMSPSPQVHLALLSQWDPAASLPAVLGGAAPKKGDTLKGAPVTPPPAAAPVALSATVATAAISSTAAMPSVTATKLAESAPATATPTALSAPAVPSATPVAAPVAPSASKAD